MASGRFRPSSQRSPSTGGRTVFGLRPVAIGLMVAGAAGFIAARVLFSDQVLCLLGSTLVTFAGLAMIVTARRRVDAGYTEAAAPSPQPAARARSQAAPPGDPGTAWMEQLAQRQADYQPPLLPLAERAAAIFRQQGAQVSLDAQHEDRSVLQIQTREGERYTAMILEGAHPADAAEVRGLYALATSAGVDGALLIAAGGFTPRAIQWAQGRPVRLVDGEGLADLNI